jgi:molybdopterin-guanine dinucleotide biosynthesis protein MobB
MAGPPLVIHIVGLKNTGKTSLMELLVQELNGVGIATGALKHDASGHFHWDKEGTDTHGIRAAGSQVTAILSDREFAIQANEGLGITLQEIVQVFFRRFDILLVEGFKKLRGRKVEVLRQGFSTHPLCTEEELVATFGDRLFERDVPHYTRENVRDLAERISQLLRERTSEVTP